MKEQDLAIPVIYSNIQLSRVTAVGKLSSHLHAADTKWDDIRRISYSTPGRWSASMLHVVIQTADQYAAGYSH